MNTLSLSRIVSVFSRSLIHPSSHPVLRDRPSSSTRTPHGLAHNGRRAHRLEANLPTRPLSHTQSPLTRSPTRSHARSLSHSLAQHPPPRGCLPDSAQGVAHSAAGASDDVAGGARAAAAVGRRDTPSRERAGRAHAYGGGRARRRAACAADEQAAAAAQLPARRAVSGRGR
eukprot:113871-Chlamydomonas_euryale.AAC.1